MDAWNPTQYHRFADARLRPAVDLLAQIAQESLSNVYDLGCGSGRTTGLLARRWPEARIVGIDSSARMLEAARRDFPHVAFVQADLATWMPEAPADILFSNAALHWLDDHPALISRLFGFVRPGGTFAVQMPRNHDQPSHQAITAVAAAAPWAQRLRPLLRPSPVSQPAEYYALLAPAARTLSIWETIYLQVLEGANPVAEWMKGTALGPLLEALAADEREEFESAYRARVAEAYPPQADGKTLFPFRRLFIVAERPGHG